MALPNPIISLPFNGDFLDKSGNGNDLIPSGIIIDTVNKKIGSGSAFGDGINDDGEIADSPSLDAAYITVAVWIKYTSGATIVIAERGDGTFVDDDWSLLQISSKLRFGAIIGGTFRSADSPMAYNDGAWHLVVGLLDATHIRIFIDNIHRASTAFGSSLGASSDPITLFARKGKLFPLPGNLDSFLFYGEALSFGGVAVGDAATGQVAEIWNGGAGIEFLGGGAVGRRRRMLLRSN